MKFEIEKVTGLGDYDKKDNIYTVVGGKAFLVLHPNTIEVRTDGNLKRLLTEKYESVMESRYFGKGGIEIVLSGQLALDEVQDIVRLSYNLTKN